MQTVDSSDKRPKRPVFLLVICILSFVWIGWGVLQGTAGLFQGPDSKESIENAIADLDEQMLQLKAQGMDSWEPTVEKIKVMVVVLNDNFYAYQALAIFIYILGFIAVLQMFRGKKLGFHLYVLYSLLSICDYYFFLSPSAIPTFVIMISAIFSGIFVSLYAANLKWMR